MELVPLSPTLYRYEVTHEFYPSLIGEKTTAYMASVIDKVPDSVTIDYVFNEIKPWRIVMGMRTSVGGSHHGP